MEEKRRSEWLKDSDSITNGQVKNAIPSMGGRAPPGQNGTDQAFSTKKRAWQALASCDIPLQYPNAAAKTRRN